MVKIDDIISQEVRDKITRKFKIDTKKIPRNNNDLSTSDPNTLSYSEKELLKKHYLLATSLESGTRNPRNNAQKHFVSVCKGKAEPVTGFEKIYKKYMKIRELEKELLRSKRRSLQTQATQKESSAVTKETDVEKQRRKENADALLRLAERQQKGPNISEYEEGYPKSEFGSREDHKNMRARDWGDMKRRNNE